MTGSKGNKHARHGAWLEQLNADVAALIQAGDHGDAVARLSSALVDNYELSGDAKCRQLDAWLDRTAEGGTREQFAIPLCESVLDLTVTARAQSNASIGAYAGVKLIEQLTGVRWPAETPDPSEPPPGTRRFKLGSRPLPDGGLSGDSRALGVALRVVQQYAGRDGSEQSLAIALAHGVAIAHRLELPEAVQQLVGAYRDAGRPSHREADYVAIAFLKPADRLLHNGQPEAALANCELVLELLAEGDDYGMRFQAHALAGAALSAMDRHDEEAESFRAAVRELPKAVWSREVLQPRAAWAYCGLLISERTIQHEEALAGYALEAAKVLRRIKDTDWRRQLAGQVYYAIAFIAEGDTDPQACLRLMNAAMPYLAGSRDLEERKLGAFLAIEKFKLLQRIDMHDDAMAVVEVLAATLGDELLEATDRAIEHAAEAGEQERSLRATALFIQSLVYDYRNDSRLDDAVAALYAIDPTGDEGVEGVQEMARENWQDPLDDG